jgi:hypothetical protein
LGSSDTSYLSPSGCYLLHGSNLFTLYLVKHGLVAVEGPSHYDLQTGHIDPATDGSEAWFGLSVFHQLHYLRALRDLVGEQKIGVPSRHWGGPDHLEHCLNMIRQGIVCSADTTLEWPLYVKEGFETPQRLWSFSLREELHFTKALMISRSRFYSTVLR